MLFYQMFEWVGQLDAVHRQNLRVQLPKGVSNTGPIWQVCCVCQQQHGVLAQALESTNHGNGTPDVLSRSPRFVVGHQDVRIGADLVRRDVPIRPRWVQHLRHGRHHRALGEVAFAAKPSVIELRVELGSSFTARAQYQSIWFCQAVANLQDWKLIVRHVGRTWLMAARKQHEECSHGAQHKQHGITPPSALELDTRLLAIVAVRQEIPRLRGFHLVSFSGRYGLRHARRCRLATGLRGAASLRKDPALVEESMPGLRWVKPPCSAWCTSHSRDRRGTRERCQIASRCAGRGI
mmetsp:Transcript_92901/g.215921  ORF Transcript_92901/g.215921 Transcript_92901/m.215921 type:complete len:293 (-) Transcript_92901:132-1010(-)